MAIPHADILAVGTRQTHHGLRAEILDGTDDLRLLAAHHVGHAMRVLTTYSGHDESSPAAFPIDRAARPRDSLEVDRTGEIRHLFPALTAPDHAAHKDRAGFLVEPGTGFLGEDIGKPAGLDGQNPARGGAPIEDPSLGVEAVGAESAGAPIDPDHDPENKGSAGATASGAGSAPSA